MRKAVLRRLLWRACLSACVLLGPHVAVQAQGGVPGYPESFYAFDPREVAMLPAFCKHTEYFRQKVPGGADAEQVAKWRSIIGDPFVHIHHYCFALLKTNRAVLLTRTAYYRNWYLQDSLGEFQYVLDRVPQNFILLPEILTKRGENLVRLNQGPVGALDFERAIELNSTYWPAYAQLSDHYKGLGQIDKARTVLLSGLEHSPDTPALTRRLADLNDQHHQDKRTSKAAGADSVK